MIAADRKRVHRSLAVFPVECWLNVATHLRPSDVVSLRGVCHAFDVWVRSDAVWRGICRVRHVGLSPLSLEGWYDLAASLRVQRYPLRAWGNDALTCSTTPLAPRGEWSSIARWCGGLLEVVDGDERGLSALRALLDAQTPATRCDAECRPTRSVVVVPVGLNLSEARSVISCIEARTKVLLSINSSLALCESKTEPTLSALDVVTTSRDGVTAEMFWALLPGNCHAPAIASFLRVAWHVASRIIVVARDNDSLAQWTTQVGEHMPIFSGFGSFVTPSTAPDVDICVARGCVEVSWWLTRVPVELRSWLAGATNEIRAIPWLSIDSAKPFHVPGWVAPWVSHAPGASTIIRMAIGGISGEGFWGISAARNAAAAHHQQAKTFYSAAMEEALEEHIKTHPGMPMDSRELADLHAVHFHSALRSFAAATVGLTDGSDLHRSLLDIVALDIGAAFRGIWKRNNSISKKWCTAVFSAAFNDVHRECLSIRSTMNAVQWGLSAFIAVRRYKSAAKGLRVTDIMVEELRNTTIPMFEHITGPLMSSVCRGIAGRLIALCDDAMATAARDSSTSGVQRTFTAHASTVYAEWAATSTFAATERQKLLEVEANDFEAMHMQRFFGTYVPGQRRTVIEQNEARGARQRLAAQQLLAAVPKETRNRLGVVPH